MISQNPNVQRLALKSVRLVELHLKPLPPLPQSIASLPGMLEWWEQMRLMRESDQEAIRRAIFNSPESA